MAPMLSLFNISKFTVKNLDLTLQEGEILTLLGPSGSGKTTLLRIIAGLEVPDTGVVRLGDRVVCNDDDFVPPEERKIGMVFQNHGLFPHLNVADNITFGLRKMSKADKLERLNWMLKVTNLAGLEKRYPHQLSGGEQQRVALARALATRPKVILFDEPFANLDEHLRENLRLEMRDILKKYNETAIFVSHDQKDALSLSDRIAVLNDGDIEQIGTPEAVYAAPQSAFVAEYFGRTNLVNVTTTEDGFKAPFGEIKQAHKIDPGKEGKISLRPQWCLWDEVRPMCKGEVKDILYYGTCQEVTVDIEHRQDLVIHLHRHEHVSVGQEIGVSIDAPPLNLLK